MLVTVDNVGYESKPQSNRIEGKDMYGNEVNQISAINNRLSVLKPKELTVENLIEIVLRGCSFTNVFVGRRKKDNFKEAWFLAVDVDNLPEEFVKEDLRTTVEGLCNSVPLPNLSYTTFSSTGEHLKFRMVWVLKEAITEVSEFENVITPLVEKLFGDRACKDCSRLFFGTKKDAEFVVFSTEAIGLSEFPVRKITKKEKKQIESKGNGNSTFYSLFVLERYLEPALRNWNENFSSRYHALFVTTVRFTELAVKLDESTIAEIITSKCSSIPDFACCDVYPLALKAVRWQREKG